MHFITHGLIHECVAMGRGRVAATGGDVTTCQNRGAVRTRNSDRQSRMVVSHTTRSITVEQRWRLFYFPEVIGVRIIMIEKKMFPFVHRPVFVFFSGWFDAEGFGVGGSALGFRLVIIRFRFNFRSARSSRERVRESRPYAD